MPRFTHPAFNYQRSPDQDAARPVHHKVVVVGAGLVGLTASLDLAQRGVRVLLLDDDNTVSVGSRSICQAKRTLEIWDRLGCAAPMLEKGVTWQVGRIFRGAQEVYNFDLQPEGGHRFPAFINLQQYYVEQFLLERLRQQPNAEIRWRNKVTGTVSRPDGVRLSLETPDGSYDVEADWVIAADGARSAIRRALNLKFLGREFQDRFLIADLHLPEPPFGRRGPTERWFWFEPTFHAGDSALLHRQADDVWRLDFQLGADADPDEECRPERVIPRVRAALGEDFRFEFEWLSVYRFQCRRLEKFRHSRVLFAGDAAHQVSPFGARGGNSGVQDADNLAWKLALVVTGEAPERLLDSYDAERGPAADENILASSRSTDFMSPKSKVARQFRDAVLALAGRHTFARRLINSGRLSTATMLDSSPLSTPDLDPFPPAMRPGSAAADAPVRVAGKDSWLLEHLRAGFTGLCFGDADPPSPVPVIRIGAGAIEDRDGLVARRYDGRPGTFYLFRPDQHVAARWRMFDSGAVSAALARATGKA